MNYKKLRRLQEQLVEGALKNETFARARSAASRSSRKRSSST
jgi:hypothetical protein